MLSTDQQANGQTDRYLDKVNSAQPTPSNFIGKGYNDIDFQEHYSNLWIPLTNGQ